MTEKLNFCESPKICELAKIKPLQNVALQYIRLDVRSPASSTTTFSYLKHYKKCPSNWDFSGLLSFFFIMSVIGEILQLLRYNPSISLQVIRRPTASDRVFVTGNSKF